MGFRETTWATCQKCRKTFGCGCVIRNVCDQCLQAECVHEYMPLEDLAAGGEIPGVLTVRFCKKCLKREGEK